MADHLHGVHEGMQVLGSDGGVIGHVVGTEGDQIAVQSAGEHHGHHHIPADWIARIDDHVHLNRPAGLAWDTAPAHGAAAASHHGQGHVHDEASGARKFKWVPWAILALLVLMGVYYLVRGLDYASRETNYQESANGVMNAPDA